MSDTKKIALWRLGSPEQGLLPTQKAIDKLAKMLRDAPQGDMHMVWGPDISMEVVEVPEGIQEVANATDPSPDTFMVTGGSPDNLRYTAVLSDGPNFVLGHILDRRDNLTWSEVSVLQREATADRCWLVVAVCRIPAEA